MPRNRRAVMALAALAGVSLLGPIVQGATLSWDPDGAGGNVGGAGAWNTTSPFWTADGINYVNWSNANPDSAIFGGTSGVVSLAEAITANALTFNINNYTIDLNG